MENENNIELKNLAKYFGADRMISKEDIEKILAGIFKLLSNFKKDNEQLNADTKKEVDDVVKTLKILQRELEQDIKDGKKEMRIEFNEQVEDLKFLIEEFKKIKPKDGKPGTAGKDADETAIVERVLELVRVENKTEIVEILGETIIDKINSLDHSPENLIDISRIKGWERFDKKSKNGLSPTVLMNAMDLDSTDRADGYAIVWDATNNRHKYAASAGGGSGSGTVNSGTQYRLAYYATTGTAVSQLSAITASRVLISDTNGLPTHSSVTSTTLAYLDATSSIQTQLDAKQATITGGATTIATTDLTASRALVSNASGKVAVSSVTATELGYLSGVSSAIQTQIDTKITASSTDSLTNKTINASNNTITNITLSMFAVNVIDTDTTLAANSDSRVATQKAVKAYVDSSVTGLLELKGSTDCSTNPNYPSALKGDSYYVTVAGKIGGASGKSVDVGDVYVALADNAGGTEASVGTSWFVMEHNLSGVALTSGTLAQFAATSSSQLAGVISDETGSGALVFANTPTLVSPILGTPTSGTLTNCTGLPISTGVSGLGTGIATFLATPSSANLISAITDETGTGALVFANTPTLVTPILGVATATSLTTTGNIELGNASDTTIARLSAGQVSIEGVQITTISNAVTVTNKRNQPRVYSTTNNASLTPEIDTYDIFHLTAMSANTTINNKSTSTPADGEQMRFRFLDNGTARTLTWGTDYVAKAGVTLPTTTTINKNLIVLFEWNANLTKWNCLATGLEA